MRWTRNQIAAFALIVAALLQAPAAMARLAVASGAYDWVDRLGTPEIQVGTAAVQGVADALFALLAPVSGAALVAGACILLPLSGSWPVAAFWWAAVYAPVAVARIVLLGLDGRPEVQPWIWAVAHTVFLVLALREIKPARLGLAWGAGFAAVAILKAAGPIGVLVPAGAAAWMLLPRTHPEVAGLPANCTDRTFQNSLAALSAQLELNAADSDRRR